MEGNESLNSAMQERGLTQVELADAVNPRLLCAGHEGTVSDRTIRSLAAQATSITKRDPLFASLAHARTAIGHSNFSDRQAALRSLGHAGEALGKAGKDQPRPSWMAFYGPAELTAMTAIVRDRIGDSAEAEAASHKALGAISNQFRRNRALATTRLALAQLHQRDIDQACSTASNAFELMTGTPMPGRMRSLLGDFYRDLITLAPDAGVAREWGDRYRAEWSRG